RGAAGGVDGTGATAFAMADELGAAVDQAAEAVTNRHEEELAEFDAGLERLGDEERAAMRRRRRIEERQRREARRTRIDLLLEGVTALETVYRDALGDPAPALNRDLARVSVAPRAAAGALDACREAREAFVI